MHEDKAAPTTNNNSNSKTPLTLWVLALTFSKDFRTFNLSLEMLSASNPCLECSSLHRARSNMANSSNSNNRAVDIKVKETLIIEA